MEEQDREFRADGSHHEEQLSNPTDLQKTESVAPLSKSIFSQWKKKKKKKLHTFAASTAHSIFISQTCLSRPKSFVSIHVAVVNPIEHNYKKKFYLSVTEKISPSRTQQNKLLKV